VSKIDKFVVRL